MKVCIILAAGMGKRMSSMLPKVVHPVLGVPMVLRVVRQAIAAGYEEPVAVVGHGRESVLNALDGSGALWAVQEQQLGTAHAVMCGLRERRGEAVTVLLGDVPLLRSGTITLLEESRSEAGAAVAVLTARPPDPSGYGRVIREGDILREIVEEKDCTPEQLSTGEINTGLMSFDGEALSEILLEIGTDNRQGEYYLTDAVGIAVERGLSCIAVPAADHREVCGVNNRVQLAEATEVLRRRVLKAHLEEGVDIPDPGTVWIEESVTIGRNVSVGRCVRLSGRTAVGNDCTIGDGSVVVDADVPDGRILPPFSVMGWEG